jgi:hypothetical protein
LQSYKPQREETVEIYGRLILGKIDKRLQACCKSSGNMPSNMPVLKTILSGNETAARKVLIRLLLDVVRKTAYNMLNGPSESDGRLGRWKADWGRGSKDGNQALNCRV